MAAITELAVSAKDAARMLGVCPGTVRNLWKAGEIPAVFINRRRLFPTNALRAYLDDHTLWADGESE